MSELISARRIACKIDKVAGIVESERIDERNGLYQNALKQGDFLLNRIQKLSRVIEIWLSIINNINTYSHNLWQSFKLNPMNNSCLKFTSIPF